MKQVVASAAVAVSFIGSLPLFNVPRFDSPTPFAMRVNDSGQEWTPSLVEDQYKITSFGQLKAVVIRVTGKNIESVMSLVEWWTGEKIQVILKFPSFLKLPRVGTTSDPEPFGLTRKGCYSLSTTSGRYHATKQFRRELARSCREYGKLVTVA